MMERSSGPGVELVSGVSIRSLAASLGLAKDTVARAIRPLRHLGVTAAARARASACAFEAAPYLHDLLGS